MVFTNASGVNCKRLFRSMMAALLTNPSILPKADIAASAIFFGAKSCAKSAIQSAALFPN
jgi:hypothetical protein